MSQDLQSVYDAARELSPDDRRRLAERLLEEANGVEEEARARETTEVMAILERTRGTIKGLDRDTIIWLAEDEELCGY